MTEHDGPPPRPTEVRGPDGKFIRTPEQVAWDAHAAGLRGEGKSYRAIGREMGVSVSNARAAVYRAFKDIAEPAAHEARQAELAILEAARDAALDVLARQHVTVSNGKVIYLGDQPLEDDGPILQAAQTVARISAAIHDLMGWKAPAKVQLAGEVTYQLVGVDPELLA